MDKETALNVIRTSWNTASEEERVSAEQYLRRLSNPELDAILQEAKDKYEKLAERWKELYPKAINASVIPIQIDRVLLKELEHLGLYTMRAEERLIEICERYIAHNSKH